MKTTQDAQAENRASRIAAIADILVLRQLGSRRQMESIAATILDKLAQLPLALADTCDNVDDQGRSCDRELGHPSYVMQDRIVDKKMVAVQIDTWQGHYTYDYEDSRRPDGTHPWDY